MQYYGNLALREERKESYQPQQQPKHNNVRKQQPSPGPRRRSIPVGEKLIYLFTVALLVGVAGLILYRSAGLYEMNREIQKTSKLLEQTTTDSKELQREVSILKDPSRIEEIASKKLGMVRGEDPITLSTGKD